MSDVPVDMTADAALVALREGKPVVLPVDTVYGLCASPHGEEPVRALYELKGRGAGQPSALLAADLDALLEAVPELEGVPAKVARALLPGPFTLIFPNPSRRFPRLTGTRPETIGVRVPELPAPTRRVVDQFGAVAATSANLPGEPDPATLDEVPEQLRAGAGAVIDGGRLPGIPSTILDLTGREPRVIRGGVVAADEALARVRAVL